MNPHRAYDPDRDAPLMSGYADGELAVDDRALVEAWLHEDPRAREELDRVVQMKAFTDHLALRPAPEEAWDGFRRRMSSRTERGLGWLLFWAGAGIVGMYVLVRVVAVVVAMAVPLIVRLGVGLSGVGLLVLLVSAIRERLYTRKRDRYDDIVR